ncbi:integrase arm-type DNA-binding domain-containing protein [Achromobacter mucicolens]|uniref:tyrosine-type recombinase/integrase n=1 Tax=Achromobacter mucicolens TaxID=1389922 RepID=UPI00244BDD92|nr:site-specific integrase [Achromobacter mucicolens]MDG9966951.1 integrase arm-type DNA-binding domain-containing protein [Achromobacter mucicolens]
MLSELTIKHATEGMHLDGAGLYLQVSKSGAKSWIFRYQLDKRRREMGLGSLSAVPAKEARRKAMKARALLADGVDPVENRDQLLAEASERAERSRAKAVTFRDSAEDFIKANRAGWRNAKHGKQWESTLAKYAYPVIGDMPIGDVDDASVLRILQPIWTTKTETASRVRGRIECVLDAAKARKLREGENPARWRGHLDKLLPKPTKVSRVRHHPALPYMELPGLVAQLHGIQGVSALALEFLIYTAARSGEVLRATWDEVSDEDSVWSLDGERMKAGKPHRVPLSAAAKDVLRRARAINHSKWIFPGLRSGSAMSDMALTMLLRRLRPGYTVHGFRSSFRDWAAEKTDYPFEMGEMALAHSVGSKVEAAYRRGDMLERRRQMMQDWADWCGSKD